MQPIAIAAGGTGGHFYPAEALAAELIARGHRVALITDSRSAALTSSVFAGCERFSVSGAGLAGRSLRQAMRGAILLLAGTLQARRILKSLNPSVLIGFGGYSSVAPVLAARSLRRRPAILLQEQNAVLGRANVFLCRLADRLALGTADTRRVPEGVVAVVTGNPVRPAIASLRAATYVPPDRQVHLLVLGGSLGARIFSDVVPGAVAALPDALRDRLTVTQQCRQEDIARVSAIYRAARIDAELSPFFVDVAGKLAAAHLVIARAGASSCAELAMAGRPAILVPLPGAIDDHQTANASALHAVGGAWVIAQSAFNVSGLNDMLARLLTEPAALGAASLAAASVAHPDAVRVLADMVENAAVAGALA